jgi:hypothetical protein
MIVPTLSLTPKTLFACAVDNQLDDPWRQRVPKEVGEKWEQDIAAFNEQEKTSLRARAKTVSEFKSLLKHEAKWFRSSA